MINPGKYNKKIKLFRIDNAATETLSEADEVWASVQPVSGDRLLVFQQLQMGVWYEIEFLRRDDLSIVEGDPIGYGDETMIVHSMYNAGDFVTKIKAFVKRG
ncbi:MAG: hypothetical protein WC343_08075 [Bacilli bacterium]|jgi:hypothetical protein